MLSLTIQPDARSHPPDRTFAEPVHASLRDGLPRDGQWLFRHRGVLPFVLLPPLGWSLWHFRWLGDSAALQTAWNAFCLLVSLTGYLLRVTTVGFVPEGTSGRNTRDQLAVTLNTTGWYSVTRNPLYLGNFLVGLGFPLTTHDPLLVLCYGTAFWIYYERIISAEETFLAARFGATYREWADRTPAFLPRWRNWQRPAMPFRWRMVLRREYTSLLLMGLMYFCIAGIESGVVTGRWIPALGWWVWLTVTASAFLGLRYCKKHTGWLAVRAP